MNLTRKIRSCFERDAEGYIFFISIFLFCMEDNSPNKSNCVHSSRQTNCLQKFVKTFLPGIKFSERYFQKVINKQLIHKRVFFCSIPCVWFFYNKSSFIILLKQFATFDRINLINFERYTFTYYIYCGGQV